MSAAICSQTWLCACLTAYLLLRRSSASSPSGGYAYPCAHARSRASAACVDCVVRARARVAMSWKLCCIVGAYDCVLLLWRSGVSIQSARLHSMERGDLMAGHSKLGSFLEGLKAVSRALPYFLLLASTHRAFFCTGPPSLLPFCRYLFPQTGVLALLKEVGCAAEKAAKTSQVHECPCQQCRCFRCFPCSAAGPSSSCRLQES